MPGCNEKNCTCPYADCPRHGKCCACVNHHRDDQHDLPNCLTNIAQEFVQSAAEGSKRDV